MTEHWCEPTSSSILCKEVVHQTVQPSSWALLAHKLVLVYHVNTCLGFEVFMAINITIKVLWNVLPCRLVNKCHCFGGTKCLIFTLHTIEDGNFKGLFVCFCLSYLLACLCFFSLSYFAFFFSLPISDFLSFIIDSLCFCAWLTERKAHFLFHRSLYHSGTKCHEELL
jgi:hypothetical protein